MAKKKSPEEMLTYYKAQVEKLEREVAKLDKASPGIDEVIKAIDTAVKNHKYKVTDIIDVVNRSKRLGLQITKKERKPRGTGAKKSASQQ